MNLIRLLFKLLSYLESHATHQGLSLGVCVGMLLGLSPINTLQFWLFLPLLFIIRLNLTTALFSFCFFVLASYLGEPIFSRLGEQLLSNNSLIAFWSFLYNSYLIPFTNFYVPETLGRLLTTLSLLVPLFVISMKLCKALDASVYHWWRTTKFYTWYRTYKPYAR